MLQSEAMAILKMGKNVFLTGPPGSGKTFLLNKYIEYLRSHGAPVAVTASTGIAATHMQGITIHAWSGLGIRGTITDGEIRAMMKRPYLRKRIRGAKVLVIDEISMLSASQFEAIDRICQYFRASFEPFGGLQVVVSGDFFQLPPVVRDGEDARFAAESASWEAMQMQVCYLEEQFRHEDAKLFELLNHMRANNPAASKQLLLAAWSDQSRTPTAVGGQATKLFTHNADADEINQQELANIAADEKRYEMTWFGSEPVVEFLRKSCLAPEKLVLKPGAKVMFVKNNFDEGYVNGTQGTVEEFDEFGLPVVRTFDGSRIVAQRAMWQIEDESGKPVGSVGQIPLRLAWAITVHKSQGMNLDAARIDLSKCFVEGMGYVALSRVRKLSGLEIMGVNDMAFCVQEKAVELDGNLRERSTEAQAWLKKLPAAEQSKRQKVFLDYIKPAKV